MGRRLELVWPGKDQFLLTPADHTGKPVWVPWGHPAAHEIRTADWAGQYGHVNDNDPYSDNLLFTGDSLDVLRILTEVPQYRQHYRGKVKLIYIDPPFNTGQTFEHYDDWMEHSTWLSFMRDRLLLLRELLAPDGSIWVHLDDVEAHRMRCLLDEVFGESRFVASIVWQKKYSRDNRPALGPVHDYILVYASAGAATWKNVRNLVPRTDTSQYRNPNDDPNGPWRAIPMDVQGGHATPSQFYDVVTPSGRVVRPSNGRAWAVTEPVMQTMISEGRVYFGLKGDGMPNTIRYLKDDQGLVPWTWWPHTEVGHNDDSKKEIIALFGKDTIFDTPKPERLMHRVIHIATNPGDIVVDLFAGSGTTAAVAHKMNRRWITAEVSIRTAKQFTLPRLNAVVEGTDQGGVTQDMGWTGGGGFRTLTVGPSLYADTPLGTLLTEAATGERFTRAMAGQLGFTYQPDAAPLCGHRGRMRLAVVEGIVGPEEITEFLTALTDRERLTVVALGILPDTEQFLADRSPGSRILKAPRDVLRARRVRRRDRT